MEPFPKTFVRYKTCNVFLSPLLFVIQVSAIFLPENPCRTGINWGTHCV